MLLCDAHWADLEARIADRDVSRDEAERTIEARLAFDRAPDGGCPVCLVARNAATVWTSRWLCSAELKLMSMYPRRML